MDRRLLDVLACPICKGKLDYKKKQQELLCHYNKVAYPVRDGIPVLTENQARPLTEKEKQ
jgi:uncharacterized protein YbaR (Trm112 family)